jgi:hypothetical protein
MNSIDNTLLASLMMILVVPILLLTYSVQAVNAEDQKINRHDTKQLIHQQTACNGREVNCHPVAINIICMKGSVCHNGYDAPLLMATPH